MRLVEKGDLVLGSVFRTSAVLGAEDSLDYCCDSVPVHAQVRQG